MLFNRNRLFAAALAAVVAVAFVPGAAQARDGGGRHDHRGYQQSHERHVEHGRHGRHVEHGWHGRHIEHGWHGRHVRPHYRHAPRGHDRWGHRHRHHRHFVPHGPRYHAYPFTFIFRN